jgi:hypothetical protein
MALRLVKDRKFIFIKMFHWGLPDNSRAEPQALLSRQELMFLAEFLDLLVKPVMFNRQDLTLSPEGLLVMSGNGKLVLSGRDYRIGLQAHQSALSSFLVVICGCLQFMWSFGRLLSG